MNKNQNINARAHQPGREFPEGWLQYSAEGRIKVDGLIVSRSLKIQAASIFEASKYSTLVAESEGSLVCAFKIKKVNK